MTGPTKDGIAKLEMSRPIRVPTSSSGEKLAVALPIRLKKPPLIQPYSSSPTTVGAVPILGGTQNAKMEIAEANGMSVNMRHMPYRSARAPITNRPTTDPAPMIAMA